MKQVKYRNIGYLWIGAYCLLVLLFASCHDGNDIKMIDFNGVKIPANVSDFNKYIKDSLYHGNVVECVRAMLEYKPEDSFEYPFEYSENKANLNILETDDKKIRFYSFTLPYEVDDITLVQYKSESGLHTDIFNPWVDDSDEVIASKLPQPKNEEERYGYGCCVVRDIHSLRGKNDNQMYLVHSILSPCPREVNHAISVIEFRNGHLKKTPVFYTGKKHQMSINTYMMCYDSDKWKRPDSIYCFNPQTNNLYIPLTDKDDEFMNKYFIYHFDGIEFRYEDIR